MMEIQTVYFPEPGSANTRKTFEVVKKRAEELGIRTIVVASTSGATGLRAVKVFGNYKVVIVAHTTGFQAPDAQELTQQNRAKILEKGARTDEEVISIGGTGRGADTALVVKPAHTQDFFELRVKELLCKPR